VVKIIKSVGNYGEIYARNFNSDILPRDKNELYGASGLQYALPLGINPTNLNGVAVAKDDTAETKVNTSVKIYVLSNDNDLDNDPLSLSIVSAPGFGQVTVDDNGTLSNKADDFIIFTPNKDFVGTDTFVYQVSDGQGSTDTANVNLTILTNKAPSFTSMPRFSITENSTSVGTVKAEDPEKDAIIFALAGVDYRLLAIDPSTGQLTFNTAPNFESPLNKDNNNLYQVRVKATDTGNNEVIQDITIEVTNVNEAPIAIDDFLSISIAQGTIATINPLINDSDPEGDILNITQKTDGEHGKVDIKDGQLTYSVLDANYTGSDVFNYTLSDPQGLTAIAEVHVTITGKPITNVITNPVTVINSGSPLIPVEAGQQTNIVDNLSYTFSGDYNRTQIKQSLENTIGQTSAAFNNIFGLYQIDDVTGAVSGILPGQPGYATAALSKIVPSFAVRAGGSGNEITGDLIVSDGKVYAPFVIANGGNFSGTIQDAVNAFFSINPDNKAATAEDYTILPVAYFSFGTANPDGAAHIKSLGKNVFGFEDLPAGVGVSDYDFNDTVFSFG
jgi:3-phytase